MGLSPSIIYYVHTETLDVPMLFWLSAALYCYVRVLQTFETRYYVWLAVLAVLATASKDYAYGVFVLMPLPLVWHVAKHRYGSVSPASLARAALDRRHWLALATFLVAFALAENLVWNFKGFVNHVLFISHNDPAGRDAVVSSQLGRYDALSPVRLLTTAEGLRFVLGWVGLPVCLLGAAGTLFRRPAAAALLLWPLGSYYFFTVVQFLPADYLGSAERPFLPMGLILALFGGALLAWLWESTRWPVLARCGTATVLAAVLVNGFAVDLALLLDPRYQAERWLAEHVAPETPIELHGPRAQLPRAYHRKAATIFNHTAACTGDRPLRGENIGPEALDRRRPAYLIVSEEYLLQCIARDGPLAVDRRELPGLQAHFRSLEGGSAGYQRVAVFEPDVVRLFRFPPSPFPGVIIYRRTS
jgi:hypothetical protein